MEDCKEDLMDFILEQLKTAPDGQIDEQTRSEFETFGSKSLGEKYDFIVEVSKRDLTQISSFVRELCALDKHYNRPI